jgi:hypothetical protein
VMRVAATENQVFTVGLGTGVAADALMRFGRAGYTPVADWTGLGDALARVGGRIETIAASYYRLEYCSARRAGMHDVTVRLNVPNANAAEVMTSYSAQGFGGLCGSDM